MQRSDYLQLIDAALANGQAAYARSLAQRYLADWPGDLAMQFALARAMVGEKDRAEAVRVLAGIVAADPEDFRAQRLLAEQALLLPEAALAARAFACAFIGDGLPLPPRIALPAWAASVRAAYLAERVGDGETARRESARALAAAVDTPLPSLIHLSSLWHTGQLDLARPLAEGFAARWSQVVALKLCLAECLFAGGEHGRAVGLLHDAAAHDLAGQVAARHWGDDHPYRTLWEAPPSASLPGPLPAELIAALGLNRLRPGPRIAKAAEEPAPEAVPAPVLTAEAPPAQPSESVAEIQAQLDSLAAQLRTKASSASTAEHYVIVSSRDGLTRLYGPDGFAVVDATLRRLGETVAAHRRLIADVVYVDDETSLGRLGLRPAAADNAWEIKHLLTALAASLKARGHAMAALLIVGGPDVIPFHLLPNPTDDPDDDIPSDNPYATSDDNYFVPEWPVGRIPSGVGRDPEPLLRALRYAVKRHQGKAGAARRSWLLSLWQWIVGRPRPGVARARSFGYTANIWKQASAIVFDSIGDPRQMLTCPPTDTFRLPSSGLEPVDLSYFNLHGVEDGAEWYGQRSWDDADNVPEYPVALRPADVVNSGRAPLLVFSEACYGANVIGKTGDDALCLRFLDSGARAVVGSTKIAYGSISAPLIGADLLGRCFWGNVNAGLPAGEALRLAKLQMAQEMHERQGCLDGEDQKTLISFVLYGDPLAAAPRAVNASAREAKRRILQATASRTPAVTDTIEGQADLSPESVATIKAMVARYLPAMQGAEVRAAQTRRSARAGAKQRPASAKTVVTLAKTVRTNTRAHPHFARITLDDRGQVVKLAVSR